MYAKVPLSFFSFKADAFAQLSIIASYSGIFGVQFKKPSS